MTLEISKRKAATLSPRAAYALAAAVIGLALFASGTPSPLYATYRELWGFSPTVLTLIYATYAFGVLGSLLLAGRVSDEVGRRPVLVTALSVLMAATALFSVADSVAWLFAARAVQGVSLGAVVGTAAAALVEAEPTGDHRRAALAAVLGQSGGSAAGPLVAGSLAEWAPAPRAPRTATPPSPRRRTARSRP